jgi:hypothetical protein
VTLKFFWTVIGNHPLYGDDFRRRAVVKGQESDHEFRYNKYLCDFLKFDLQSKDSCKEVLSDISLVQSGGGQFAEWWGNAWFVEIRASEVQINHQQFEEWNNLPEGHFTLAEFKAAVEGWKQFLGMPVSLDSVVEIELPESR